jgi:hypothetical protein
MNNQYLSSVYRNLPRLLALFDTDVSSTTCGLGDRYHWAWGLIDFSNGTFQGAAHGLARLVDSDLLPEYLSEEATLDLIDKIFIGTEHIVRTDGSLEEAFPYEGSYCVTALVAYDLLTAIQLLGNRLTAEKITKYIRIICPLIKYLIKADENHAFISNHLATSVAALVKWTKLTGLEGEKHGLEILDSILEKQSSEGWYLEYEGADPGYQTLCTYYLADALETTNNSKLKESLIKSLDFLSFFIHPDASIGGEYGSRNTRFYYPGGIAYLMRFSSIAVAISNYMSKGVGEFSFVGLDAIDEPNLIPMFNSFCWAASLYSKEQQSINDDEVILPCHKTCVDKIFPEAGLFVLGRERGYKIISIHKGGVVFDFRKNGSYVVNTGVALKLSSGLIYTNQVYNSKNEYLVNENEITIRSSLYPAAKRKFKPYQMIVLRVLNITLMRNYYIRELVKKILVKILITRKDKLIGFVDRRISFNNDNDILDEIITDKKYELINTNRFVPIHMASKGYWQKQDTEIK